MSNNNGTGSGSGQQEGSRGQEMGMLPHHGAGSGLGPLGMFQFHHLIAFGRGSRLGGLFYFIRLRLSFRFVVLLVLVVVLVREVG